MPIPKPHDDESEDDFIARCMGNDTMQDDYPDNDQRLAVCFTQWREREKSMKTVADIIETEPVDGWRTFERIERKSIQIELKDDVEGSFIARIATLNVIDKDGDVTLPKAFPKGKEVLVSAYMHGSWTGRLPVGKATIREEGEEVLADGQFNLKTETGKEHYEAVKFSGELQEWSYGFKILELGDEKAIEKWAGQHDDARPARILKKLAIFEMSPVLLGAGIDTATLAIKNDKATYADEAQTVLATVQGFIIRTQSLADLRRKEGRVLSSKNREHMKKLLEMLSNVASDLKELLDATEPVDTEKLAQAVLLYTKIKRELTEVI